MDFAPYTSVTDSSMDLEWINTSFHNLNSSVSEMSNDACIPKNYECSDKGIILPLTNESTWPAYTRALFYFLGLLWFLLGVSIIADSLMQAIEMITSRTKRIQVPDLDNENGYIEIDIRLWNGTVANLTLMTLGASVPEIFLSIIETIGNNFSSGELGPNAILGSASFNLLFITGICIVIIPRDEIRRIRKINVFALTSVFSVFAYLWVLIVLVGITPGYVDVWEAVVTVLLFPFLVINAYMFDVEYCGGTPPSDDEERQFLGYEHRSDREVEKKDILQTLRKYRREQEIDDEHIARIAAILTENRKSHDRGWYRINAIRTLTGGRKLAHHQISNKHNEPSDLHPEKKDSNVDLSNGSTSSAVIQFADPCINYSGNDGFVRVPIIRRGNLDNRVLFRLETVDGTATADVDYISRKDLLVFDQNERRTFIDVEIISDAERESSVVFFVRLETEPDQDATVGRRGVVQVIIQENDDAGTFEFCRPSLLFKNSIGTATIPVLRRNGVSGIVSVAWETRNMTALEGREFLDTRGILIFNDGQTDGDVEIQLANQEIEKDVNFEIRLTETTGGAVIGKLNRCVITIVNDEDFKGIVSRIEELVATDLDVLRVEQSTWRQQLMEAFTVNDGDIESASVFDFAMHFLSFSWKVMFAFVPPPSLCGGWLSFFISLVIIGVMTAVIGDLASIFGCLVGLDNCVTAITFVAIGTSIPDFIASKQAAISEQWADNSVGFITGSNSVYAFLGLGLSWTVGSTYRAFQGERFTVKTGSLDFNVALYAIIAVIGIGVLVMRRNVGMFGNAELGGPLKPKLLCGTFMIFLWILYIVLSSLRAYDLLPGL